MACYVSGYDDQSFQFIFICKKKWNKAKKEKIIQSEQFTNNNCNNGDRTVILYVLTVYGE